MAGLALMYQVANWHPTAAAVWDCNEGQGCGLAGYRHAVVSWGELVVLAGWLAIGAAMTLILTRPVRSGAVFPPGSSVLAGDLVLLRVPVCGEGLIVLPGPGPARPAGSRR
jgi:hypothetical protein